MKIRDYRIILLIGVAIIIGLNLGVFAWGVWASYQHPAVSAGDIKTYSSALLCPGETLDYEFALRMSRAGEASIITSLQSVSADVKTATTLYTLFEQIHVDAPAELTIHRRFVVPPVYVNQISGETDYWAPGLYRILLTVRPAGRAQDSTNILVPFAIQLGCPEQENP